MKALLRVCPTLTLLTLCVLSSYSMPLQSGAINIALNKPAQQSSTSAWSKPNDAQGGVDGIKNGSFGFHTENQKDPWWQVDLLSVSTLNEIRVFNRMDEAGRAETIQILLSTDGKDFKKVFPPSAVAAALGGLLGAALSGRAPTPVPAGPTLTKFGGVDGHPLVVDLKGAKARYVRLQLNAATYFHLDEVEIYGTPGAPQVLTTQNLSAPPNATVQTFNPSQGGGVVGLWTWACCGGRNAGLFAIVSQAPDGTIAGQFSGLTPEDNGTIQGRSQGDRIEFTRRGTYQGRIFEQMWTGRIDASGGNRRIAGSILDQATRQQAGDFSASIVANATMTVSTGGVSQTPFIPGLDGGIATRAYEPPSVPLATGPPNFDFETGTLAGWVKTGNAFDFQPTYQDNPTSRGRGQPSKHQGNYWIGTFEKRHLKTDNPGDVQGDGPTGTLTSVPFTIVGRKMNLLIGGGCDLGTERVELAIGGRAVRSATGKCDESMERVTWDVAEYVGQTGQIRVIDASDGGWGHINFDDLQMTETVITSAPPPVISTVAVAPPPVTSPATGTAGIARPSTPAPAPTPAQTVSLPATGSGTYHLTRIEVNRKYPQGWTVAEHNIYRSGLQTLSPDQRSLRLGWDFNWGSAKENRNRSMSDLAITEVPTFIEPGEDASFAASMRGEWNTSGYGNGRDHTIRLTGALGTGQFQVGGDPNGQYDGKFETKNKTTVPQVENGVATIKSTATIRFGDDHVGEMEIRFIYEPGASRPAAVTTSAAPVVIPPARVDTPAAPQPAPSTATVAPPPAVTTPNSISTPAVAAPGLPAFSSLSFEMQLTDENGNTTLEGGERFNIRITVKNSGGAPANSVQVRLTGDPAIVSATGSLKAAGNIAPGQTQVVDFGGIMPLRLDPHTAEVRVSLLEGASELPRSQLLRVALTPANIRETTTVLSEIIDVDYPPAPISIPERTSSVAVVVGISTYRETGIPKLPYAGRDAETFAKYLENVGGVRKENIKFLSDDRAARSDVEDAVEDWLPLHVTDTSHVYFYYAGHGALDPATGETYLVPYEGSPDSPTAKMYSLKRLYEKLGALKAQNVTVFLDSCFSGGGRSIAMRGRPIVINSGTSQSSSTTNVAVLAAAGGNQVSSDYDRARHGLFTYFLLKGMRGEADTGRDGWIDLGELSSYVRDKVRATAASELNREQTPVLTGGSDLDSKRSVKLFKIQK